MTKSHVFRVLCLLPLLQGFAACGGFAAGDVGGSTDEWEAGESPEEFAAEEQGAADGLESGEQDPESSSTDFGVARQALGESACHGLRYVAGDIASWGYNAFDQTHEEDESYACPVGTRFSTAILSGAKCNYSLKNPRDVDDCSITITQHSNAGSGGQCDWAICAEPIPVTERKITVVSATYGLNCGAQMGNQTSTLAEECNGIASCSHSIDYRRIGDPVPNCAKSFEVQYQCSGTDGRIRREYAPPEAGLGSVVHLHCDN